jgi:hypothetical protein
MQTQQHNEPRSRPLPSGATHPGTGPQAEPLRVLNLWLAALVGVAVAIVVAIWLLLDGHDKKVVVPAPGGGPAAVSQAQLEGLASSTKHPVYWAGPRDGAYELTRTTDRRIYVRYLPSAEKVGDRSATYLTIGTYPSKNAFRSITRAASRPGAVSLRIANGGRVVLSKSAPKSVYFAYPGARYQVEVYSPSPDEARTLVLGGRVEPIK